MVSELEGRTLKILHCDQQKENRLEEKKEQSPRSVWDYNKRSNVVAIR